MSEVTLPPQADAVSGLSLPPRLEPVPPASPLPPAPPVAVAGFPARAGFGGLPSVPALISGALFAFLFARPFTTLVHDWWSNPDAGHGLLLAPLGIWFAWKSGIRPDARPNRAAGLALLVAAVFFRYVSDLAAELFTMRGSMVMAAAGLVTWHYGFRQVLRWWLPFALWSLSIPLPDVILNRVALPLQFTASKIGAALLAWREIPVLLTGNVIRIPQHELFVAEACSGLRSLTALLSLGVLLGAITLDRPISRAVLLAVAIPVAIVLNGIRVFLTGFLVYFIDPKLGEGFMHITEGWLIFVVAFLILGGVAWTLLKAERWYARRGTETGDLALGEANG